MVAADRQQLRNQGVQRLETPWHEGDGVIQRLGLLRHVDLFV